MHVAIKSGHDLRRRVPSGTQAVEHLPLTHQPVVDIFLDFRPRVGDDEPVATEERGADRIESAPPSLTAVALETASATGITLYVSLRWETSLVWLLMPIGLLVACRRPFSEYALDLRFEPPPLRTHLVLGATLLALYAALHAVVALAFQHRSFAPSPPAGTLVALAQEFLLTGVPEEVFFRGFLQTRWNLALGRHWRVLGARVGFGLLIQAVIFALCHLATGDWTRLRVFFFALLAGWLRERSNSVLAPAAYHAVANVWYSWLETSFR